MKFGFIWVPVMCAVVAAAQDQPAVFRSDVKLVRLLVTVKDRNGASALVDRANFKLQDNGVDQQISIFERYTSQPLSVSILMDTSGSTGKEAKYEIESVGRFTRALFSEGNPEDRACLYTFNWEVVQRTAFTRSPQQIERNLKGLKLEGGTSMYDAIWFATRDLEDREGRHVVIVVTDGGDTTSAQGTGGCHRVEQCHHPGRCQEDGPDAYPWRRCET